MKKSAIIFVLLLTAVKFTGCTDDQYKPGPEKHYMERLAFAWNLEQASVSGVDVTGAFSGLVLTINGDRSFAVANPVDPLWPAEGTFALRQGATSSDYDILRGDGVEIHVSALTPTTLRLSFQYQATGGRSSSIGGQYQFVFTR